MLIRTIRGLGQSTSVTVPRPQDPCMAQSIIVSKRQVCLTSTRSRHPSPARNASRSDAGVGWNGDCAWS
jgi:hypothetical protein